jgi:nitrogen fixation protein
MQAILSITQQQCTSLPVIKHALREPCVNISQQPGFGGDFTNQPASNCN